MCIDLTYIYVCIHSYRKKKRNKIQTRQFFSFIVRAILLIVLLNIQDSVEFARPLFKQRPTSCISVYMCMIRIKSLLIGGYHGRFSHQDCLLNWKRAWEHLIAQDPMPTIIFDMCHSWLVTGQTILYVKQRFGFSG